MLQRTCRSVSTCFERRCVSCWGPIGGCRRLEVLEEGVCCWSSGVEGDVECLVMGDVVAVLHVLHVLLESSRQRRANASEHPPN